MVRTLSNSLLGLWVGAPVALALPALMVWPWQWLPVWGEAIEQTVLITITVTVSVMFLALAMAPTLAKQGRLSILLSTPHVAFTVGFLLLLSPSGLLVRLFELALGWYPQPPNDGWLPTKSAVTVALVLILKELPFILLMTLTQMRQVPYQRWLLQAQSLGWSATRSWWLLIVPALLPRLIFPLAAIVIYTLSVVDIPLMAGPNTPSLFAVEVFELQYQWSDTDASQTGVWVLLGLSLLALVGLRLVIKSVVNSTAMCRNCVAKSTNISRILPLSAVSVCLWLLQALGVAIVLVLIMNSFAGAWFYPSLIPSAWSLERWLNEWPFLQPLLWNSFWVALLSALLALGSAIGVLEYQRRAQQLALKIVPLLALMVPQLLLVLGWQLWFGQGSSGLILVLAHTVFGFPYAYLVLHGAWVRFEERWLYQAQSLGYSYPQAWLRILVPMLKGPLLMAFALAFSVSIAQYLPTLWLAGGTLPTLATETVSIASGGDWRLASLYALGQMLLPLAIFLMVLPSLKKGLGDSYA